MSCLEQGNCQSWYAIVRQKMCMLACVLQSAVTSRYDDHDFFFTSVSGIPDSCLLYTSANIGQIIAASISKPEALAFILAVNFNVPCLMALNATLHETHSAKWTVRIALYYIATALIISCLTYHIAGLFF